MKAKQILSLLLTTAMLLSMAPSVFAADSAVSGGSSGVGSLWGNYPTHPTEGPYPWSGGTVNYSPTTTLETAKANAAERTFTIDSDTNETKKKYIILDKDENGNYFIAEGQSRQNYDPNQGYLYSENTNQTDGSAHKWKFDHTNTKSLAYWLDNTYRHNTTHMPAELNKHLVEFTWQVEGDYPRYQDRNSTLAQTIIENNPAYSTTGYVSVMSATEYQTYAPLLGDMGITAANSSGWVGVFSRTPETNINSDTTTCSPRVKYLIYQYNDAENPTDANSRFVYASTTPFTAYRVMPVFWVDKDFFSKVKVSFEDGADVVKSVLAEQDYYDLQGLGYTEAQIAELGAKEVWYGRYPTHPTANDKAYYSIGDTGVSASVSNANAAKRKFTIDNTSAGNANYAKRSYILLDKDAEGNYFVTEASTTQNIGAGVVNFFKGTATVDTSGTDNWKFDYSNTDSIAYWLDNTYRTMAATTPTVIKDNQILYDWSVEANYPYVSAGDGSASEAIKTNSKPYTTSGYTAFMSISELDAYKNIMGTAGITGDSYGSILLRTTLTKDNNGTLSGKVLTYNQPTDGTNITVYDGMIQHASHYYPRRTCFWLDKDFFSTVKVEFEDGADVVKSVLKEQGYSSLSKLGYTSEELENIGASWYGRYPKHSATNDKAYWIDNNTQLNPNVTIKEATEGSLPRLFTIDDEEFILLDKDEETGNYFISATRAITSSAGYNYTEEHNASYPDYAGETMPNTTADGKDTWGFNHKNELSIAWWLDNVLINNTTYIPASLKPHIQNFDWAVEGDYPRLTGNATEARAAKAEELIANSKPYTTNGKLAIMSATEFKAYADVLGAVDISTAEAEGWTGASFRTPRTTISSKTENGVETVSVGNNFAGFIWRLPSGMDYTEANKLESGYWAGNGGYWSAHNKAKIPVFWVDGDFFADAGVKIPETSTIVLEEFMSKDYDYYDLAGTYTDEEIEALGIEKLTDAAVPTVTNAVVSATNNETLEVAYTYNHGIEGQDADRHVGTAFADASTYQWYVADTLTSMATAIDGATGKTLPINAEITGKIVSVKISPANKRGDTGSDVIVTYAVAEVYSGMEISGAAIMNGTSVVDSVAKLQAASTVSGMAEVKNENSEARDVILIVSVYGEDGKLIGIKYDEVKALGAGESASLATETVTAGTAAKSAKLMIWNNFTGLVPYMPAKIINE